MLLFFFVVFFIIIVLFASATPVISTDAFCFNTELEGGITKAAVATITKIIRKIPPSTTIPPPTLTKLQFIGLQLEHGAQRHQTPGLLAQVDWLYQQLVDLPQSSRLVIDGGWVPFTGHGHAVMLVCVPAWQSLVLR